MKKIFSIALVACMAALAMTSCNKKDEPTPQPDNKAVSATITLNAIFDPVTIEQCDISFDYYDANGVKKNEVVTTTEFHKTVQTASLPATLGFHWNLAVKADLDTTKYEYFVVGYEFSYSGAALTAEGRPVTQYKCDPFSNRLEMAMRKRQAVVESVMNHNPISYVDQYDAQGNYTSEDWK